MISNNYYKTMVYKLIILIYFFFIQNSFAYIDPGSTSIIITVIVSGFAIIGLYFRKFMNAFKSLFKKILIKKK